MNDITDEEYFYRIGLRFKRPEDAQQAREMLEKSMNQPPAYDIKDGLRIWQDGKHVATIPEHYFANLAMRLIDEMRKRLDD